MFDFIMKFFFGTQQETEKKTKTQTETTFQKPSAYKNINSSQSQN